MKTLFFALSCLLTLNLTAATPVSLNSFFGDLNGDGKTDLVINYTYDGLQHWQGRLSNGTSYGDSIDWTSTSTPNVTTIGIADVTGDGKADLVIQYDSGGTRYWQARVSNGSSFQYTGSDWAVGTTNMTVVGLVDVNGDGKADLVLQYDSGGYRHWEARLSNGASFVSNGSDWTSTSTPNVTAVALADVNGDGKADLVLQYDSGRYRYWQARLSTGSSFQYTGSDWMSTSTPNVSVLDVKDVDGDGRADIILFYPDAYGISHWQARLSTGSSFVFTGDDWMTTSTPGVKTVAIKDVNGDGKADLVLFYPDAYGVSHWQARLSTGTSFQYTGGDWMTTSTSGATAVGVNDANGDGKADLVITYPYGAYNAWQTRLSTGMNFAYTGGDWLDLLNPNRILITSVSPRGVSPNFAQGVISSLVSTNDYKIAVYIKVPNYGWVTKPFQTAPYTTAGAGGNWTCSISTGGNDPNATEIAAFLFHSGVGYQPPFVNAASSLPAQLYQNSIDYSDVTR